MNPPQVYMCLKTTTAMNLKAYDVTLIKKGNKQK